MKVLRIVNSIILLVSTIILVTLIADFKFSGNTYNKAIFFSLQIMHLSLFINSFLYIFFFIKNKKYYKLFFTFLPILLFFLAFVLKKIGQDIPGIALILFDFYVIILYTIILICDVEDLLK